MKDSTWFWTQCTGMGCFVLLMWALWGAFVLGLAYLAVKIVKAAWVA